jgi:hypothetical protein
MTPAEAIHRLALVQEHVLRGYQRCMCGALPSCVGFGDGDEEGAGLIQGGSRGVADLSGPVPGSEGTGAGPAEGFDLEVVAETAAAVLGALLHRAVASVGGATEAALRRGITKQAVVQLLGCHPGTGNLKVKTAARLLAACGFELHLSISPIGAGRAELAGRVNKLPSPSVAQPQETVGTTGLEGEGKVCRDLAQARETLAEIREGLARLETLNRQLFPLLGGRP